MAQLYPFIPLAAGESPASFASRLAAVHGMPSVQTFLRYLGRAFSPIVAGRPEALADLANLTAVSVDDLRMNAIHRQGQKFTYREEVMTHMTMRRSSPQVCPICLSEDLLLRDTSAPSGPYGRTIWQFAPFRACPNHNVMLTPVGEAMHPAVIHDFARTIRPILKVLPNLVAAAVPIEPSRAESYLFDRLQGQKSSSPWLDNLPWSTAATVCEKIGVAAHFGKTTSVRTLTTVDWHRAADHGFCIAHQGEVGIRGFLTDLQRSHIYSTTGESGPHAVLGHFYRWLDSTSSDPANETLRDIVFRHLAETTPVGPGDVILGRAIQRRRVHSIRTASLDAGRHSRRLRKILVVADLIGPDTGKMPDSQVFFDAQKAATLLEMDSKGLNLRGVASYLRTEPWHVLTITKHGFLKPFISHQGGQGRRDTYAPAELDRFLVDLRRKAVRHSEPKSPVMGIPAAAKRAYCGSARLIRMILDAELEWVGWDPAVPGYHGILVNADEVVKRVRGPALDGFTAHELKDRLGIHLRAVMGLIAHGYLRRESCINPVNHCPVKIVPSQAVEEFNKTYISLHALAKANNINATKLKFRLDKQKRFPAITRDKVGATFYFRALYL